MSSSATSPPFFDGQSFPPYTEEPTDFLIVCGGREFKVHREVISRDSSYFKGAIKETFREGITRRLELVEESPDVINAVLRFIYTEAFDAALVHSPPGSSEATDNVPAEEGEPSNDPSSSTRAQLVGTVMSKALACALVYTSADKFDLPWLKALAREEFNWTFFPRENYMHIPEDLTEIVRQVYLTTRLEDRGLKDIVLQYCRKAFADRDIVRDRIFKNAFLQCVGFSWDLFSDLADKWSLERLNHGMATQHLRWVLNRERKLMETLQDNENCRHCGKAFGVIAELHGKPLRRIERDVWVRCRECRTRHPRPE